MNITAAATILLQPVPLIAGWVIYLAGAPVTGLIFLAVGTAAVVFASVVSWVNIVRQLREARREQEEIEQFQRGLNERIDRMTRATEGV